MINNFASLLYKTIQLTWTVAGIWLLFWQSWSVNITDLVLPVSTLTAKKNILRFFFFFFIIRSDKNPNNLRNFNFDVLPNKPFLKFRIGLIEELQASGAPELNLSILENLVIRWPYIAQPSDCPSVPQAYQCKISQQSTEMATQRQLKLILAGNRVATHVLWSRDN